MRTLPAIFLLLLNASALRAQATAPASSPTAQSLTVTITAIQGMVQVRAQLRDDYHQFIPFGDDTLINMQADKTSPAETSADKTVDDPKTSFSGRPPVDQNLLLQLPSYGGFDGRELQILQQQARTIAH